MIGRVYPPSGIALLILLMIMPEGSLLAAPRVQEILLTSEAGARLESRPGPAFQTGKARGTVLQVWPDRLKQEIHGIGSSFTESSAFVLAHLEPGKRREVMEMAYGREGANFTLTRTHIGACDFSVEGKYSYLESPGARFSIAPDSAGFDPDRYPGVRAPHYDLLPMIHEAQAIKRAQGDAPPRIIASAWTAPPWMKDIEDWYIPGTAENDYQGTGGHLKPEHRGTYADYLVRYLDAYAAVGVDIWGLTPVNEPLGNGGHWESLDFTAEGQNIFIRDFLGPRLRTGGHGDVELLIYDQNRDAMESFTDIIFADPRTADFVSGVGVHWYASTFKVFEDAFERVHARFPLMDIVHTEGCIDNLGVPAPGGVADPAGYKESGWFDNDAFWWNESATDWAYTVDWGFVDAADHPRYVPVHRYARNIIVSLDHWMNGWVDWNVVLDREGGPNHVGNMCGAPIMIDTDSGQIHYTPVFWVLAQFSRTVRPGDHAVRTRLERAPQVGVDDLHACATVNAAGELAVQVLNTAGQERELSLQLGDRHITLVVPANAVQTVRVAG